jgi:hypothetical protein
VDRRDVLASNPRPTRRCRNCFDRKMAIWPGRRS